MYDHRSSLWGLTVGAVEKRLVWSNEKQEEMAFFFSFLSYSLWLSVVLKEIEVQVLAWEYICKCIHIGNLCSCLESMLLCFKSH